MNCRCTRLPVLMEFYQRFLQNANMSDFETAVRRSYVPGTLERLICHSNSSVRRAAVLALGLIGNFTSNSVLASALNDSDRTVATLAENAIQMVWRRDGDEEDQAALQNLMRMNANGEMLKTVTYASLLLEKAPKFAEVWFQRASAWFELGQFEFAQKDLEKVLDLNPFHFNAYVMLGYVHLESGNAPAALRAFRNALDINPGLKNSQSMKRIRRSARSTKF